jgi:hypothetical protein
LVQFQFYKPETEKTKPNRTQTKKPKKTRAKLEKPSQAEKQPSQFELIFVLK